MEKYLVEIIVIVAALLLLWMVYRHRKILMMRSKDMHEELEKKEAKDRIKEEMESQLSDSEEITEEDMEHQRKLENHKMLIFKRYEYHRDEGELDEAEEKIRELMELTEDDPTVKHHLGIIHIKRGNFDVAEEIYRELTKLKLDAMHFVNLGECLLAQKKHEEALDAYEYAIHMTHEYADNYMNAGHVLELLGRTEDAIEMYEKALEIEPENGELRTHIQELLP